MRFRSSLLLVLLLGGCATPQDQAIIWDDTSNEWFGEDGLPLPCCDPIFWRTCQECPKETP